MKIDEDVTLTFDNSNLIYDITNVDFSTVDFSTVDISNDGVMAVTSPQTYFNGNVSASIRRNAEIVDLIVNNPIIFEKVKNEFPEFFL